MTEDRYARRWLLGEDEPVKRTTVEEALAAWESAGPTSTAIALMADALYGIQERS